MEMLEIIMYAMVETCPLYCHFLFHSTTKHALACIIWGIWSYLHILQVFFYPKSILKMRSFVQLLKDAIQTLNCEQAEHIFYYCYGVAKNELFCSCKNSKLQMLKYWRKSCVQHNQFFLINISIGIWNYDGIKFKM